MHDYIASRYDQFIKDLETIVNIDSGSRCAPGIEKVAAYFQERFAKFYGCDPEMPGLSGSGWSPSPRPSWARSAAPDN